MAYIVLAFKLLKDWFDVRFMSILMPLLVVTFAHLFSITSGDRIIEGKIE